MNIFLVPSWYPSDDFPIKGIFIREQVEALTELHAHLNLAVSLWGQNEESSLLWVKDHFRNLKKIQEFQKKEGFKTIALRKNLIEIYSPTLIWSDKLLGGNFKNIVKANQRNFDYFRSEFGNVDMIHAQVCHRAGLIAYELSKIYHVPYVITEQMSPFPFPKILNSKKTLKKSYNLAYQNAHRNIAISPDLKRRMEALGIPHLRFLPNLTNEDFFKPKPDLKPNKYFTFFTLGRMEAQKDIPTLLKAIPLVIKENTGIRFRIGGDGSQLKKYKALAQSLAIAEYVTWLGALDRTESLQEFQACDAFVLASQHETLGVVFIEAIACGKPIIATKCGGPECIVNENNGSLVDIGDYHDLAQKILFTVENYADYDPNIIRNDFLKHFSKKVVAQDLVNLYQEVLSEMKV